MIEENNGVAVRDGRDRNTGFPFEDDRSDDLALEVVAIAAAQARKSGRPSPMSAILISSAST